MALATPLALFGTHTTATDDAPTLRAFQFRLTLTTQQTEHLRPPLPTLASASSASARPAPPPPSPDRPAAPRRRCSAAARGRIRAAVPDWCQTAHSKRRNRNS